MIHHDGKLYIQVIRLTRQDKTRRRAPRPSHDVTMASVAHGMKKLSLHGRLASPSLRPWAGGKDPRRATGCREGLSRTPWLLAIVLLSLWQCLPSHGLTWLQLLSTIRALIGGCIDRSPGALTLHVSIGVSICRHMRAAFGLWLAQRSTRWLFPEAPPDL